MAPDDQIIKKFFHKMKEQDEHISIPLAPDYNRFRKKRWIPLSIAASLLVLFTIGFIYQESQKAEDYTVEITLTVQTANTTQSLTSHESLFESWESPTQSLIDDFN